jgi:hypothetical protein
MSRAQGSAVNSLDALPKAQVGKSASIEAASREAGEL